MGSDIDERLAKLESQIADLRGATPDDRKSLARPENNRPFVDRLTELEHQIAELRRLVR